MSIALKHQLKSHIFRNCEIWNATLEVRLLEILADPEARRLFDEADRLLNAHRKRAPHHDKITGLISKIEALQTPRARFKRDLYLARLEFALFDIDKSAQRLTEGSELDTAAETAERSALALQIARAVGAGNTASITYRIADPDAIFRALSRVAGRHSSHDRQIVSICRLLHGQRFLAALREFCKLVPQEPALFEDIVSTAKRIYRRPYKDSIAGRIDTLVAPTLRLREGRKAADQLFALKIDAQSRSARADGSAVPSPTEVQNFLTRQGRAGVGTLIQAKDLFISAFPGDEEMKLSVVEPYAAGVISRPSSMGAKKLLESAAQTRRFWDDAAFRARISDIAARAVRHETSGAASFIRGMERFLADDPAYIDHFAKAAKLSALIGTTGASSVFGGLSDHDEAPLQSVEIDMSAVARTEAAYVCCADLKYFLRYASKYAASARQFETATRLHFHIASASREEAELAFARTLAGVPNVSFSWEKPTFAVPTYYASMRFLRAADFIAHVADRIVLTDIDVIFTKSPGAFLRRMRATGAEGGFRCYDRTRTVDKLVPPRGAIYRYPRLLPWSIVNAACLYLTGDQDQRVARQVAADMRRHLGRALKQSDNAWWIDQNSLYVSLRALMPRPGMRLTNIEDQNLPFGTFDYSRTVSVSAQHPHFAGRLQG